MQVDEYYGIIRKIEAFEFKTATFTNIADMRYSEHFSIADLENQY